MLLLLSCPEKGENPVIAARTRQWTLDHILFEIKERYMKYTLVHMNSRESPTIR